MKLMMEDGRMKADLRRVGEGEKERCRLTVEFPPEDPYFAMVRVALRALLAVPAKSDAADAHTVPTNSSPLGTRSEQSEDPDSAD